jgi:hypothetical protein
MSTDTRTTDEPTEEDCELFERLAERYSDRPEGRAFELAAEALKEEMYS